MSAIFGASTKWLSATIAGATPNNNVLLAIWYKHTSGGTLNGTLIELKAATDGSFIRDLLTGSGTKTRVNGQWGGTTPVSGSPSTTLVDNTWRLSGSFIPVDDGSLGHAKNWDAGNTIAVNYTTPNTATEDLSALAIGQGQTFGSFSYWEGRLAEAAIFTTGSETEADTIMAALATQTADAITLPAGSTLIAYYPLLGDATASTGPALTDHGTVTFDGADHPSLSGAGGSSATLKRILELSL